MKVPPNMLDYERTRAAFSWDDARSALTGTPGGGVNMALEAVDRHAAGPLANQDALRFVQGTGEVLSVSYGELAASSNRFANVLQSLGGAKGDRVFSLIGRTPELYTAVAGTLKNGSVFCPLFSAFGPEPVKQRLLVGEGKVLVTTRALYRKKIVPIRDALPELRHVLLTDCEGTPDPGTEDLTVLMREASADFTLRPTQAGDMALLHFTSGTTGTPKGAVHVHDAVTAHYMTGQYALDFHPGDIYWCTADPGWVTGTSYGIISPLAHGLTTVVDQEEMDIDRWYRYCRMNR